MAHGSVGFLFVIVGALAACDGVAPASGEPCNDDRSCSDGDPCSGVESCVGGTCQSAAPVTCAAPEFCLATGECGVASPVIAACDAPRVPVLSQVPIGTTLDFAAALDVGTSLLVGATAPERWQRAQTVLLAEPGATSVFAHRPDDDCRFHATYQVVKALPGSVDDPESDAVAFDDARILGWATGWAEPVAWGTDNDPRAMDPRRAVGPAGADPLDATSLGNGGELTMTLPWRIADGPGPEFVIFENGFSDDFLELAFVAVSSDGEHFARFDALAIDMVPVGPYGTLDAAQVTGVAGRYPGGFGTPFDLAALAFAPEVRGGLVDLGAITHVRLVDIVGDGQTVDSFGHAIHDPTPTFGTSGFDLDGIGVLAPAGD